MPRVVATDPNSDTLTYELDDNTTTDTAPPAGHDVTYFSINRATGQLMVKETLDFDDKGTGADQGKYKFYVRAIDPSGETAEVEVTVTVTDANDAPKIMGSRSTDDIDLNKDIPDAASELRVMEQDSDDRNGDDQVDTMYDGSPDMAVPGHLGNMNVFTATDDDERGQITWTLRGDDSDDFELSSAGLTGPDEPIALRFKNAPDYEMPTDANGDSVYKVTLVASDGRGEDTKPLTIFVDNIHEQGMATLMAEGNDPDQPVIEMKVTAMVDDPDGGVAVVTWQWSRSMDGTNFSVIPGATMYSYTPERADIGRFLRVTATYIDTTSDMDDPETGVRDERVQGGDDPADPDPQVATTGDGVHELKLSTGKPEESTGIGKVYRVMATSANAVRVDPDDPTPPTAAVEFLAASYERMVVENAEVNSIVGDPIMATGAMSLEYDLDATETNDDAYFTVDDHGQIRVGEVDFPDVPTAGVMAVPTGAKAPGMDDPELDFEGTKAFVLIVTAIDTSDDTRKAAARVTVTLNNLNERPYFDQESREAVMGENSPIMYSESRSNRVVPLAAKELDRASLRWEVTGADASAFEIRDAQDIASDGKDRVELHFKEQPDFETRGGADNIYNVMVRATETTAVGGGPNMAATLAVMVQVTNSEEDGAVELNWLQPEVGTMITASVSDPDDGVTEAAWTWYRSKNQNPNRDPGTEVTDLTQEWELIIGQANEVYTPQGKDASNPPPSGDAVDETWFLLARVEYTDTEGGSKAAVGISANAVQADVSDADNNSPDYTLNETNRTVPENASKGTDVGRPVVVNQNEDNDILTYQLDNDNDAKTPVVLLDGDGKPTDVALFSINKATGQIMVDRKLDWDDNPNRTNPDGKYEIWVRATDPSGEVAGDENSDDINVIITATDVNEAPKITDGMAELSVNEVNSSEEDTVFDKYVGLGYQVNAANAALEVDDDNNPNLYHRKDDDNVDAARWSISGPDGNLFEYSTPSDGIGRRLHFKKANLPDYENPQDANWDNVYEVTIVAVDNSNDRGIKNVRITVMNVNEMGKLVLTPEQPDDGMPVMAVLTDPDGVESITDVKWASATSRVASFGDATLMPGATTLEIPGKGQVGKFLWAMVDYRDGYSMENDPVTALDERNDGPGTDGIFGTGDDTPIETRKLVGAVPDTLFYNSDEMESAVTDNAVQTDPSTGGGPDQTPSTEPILMDRMVYENVPSTGYVGIPLDMLGTRNMIGGPDGASFVFAEDMDNNVDLGFYDTTMVESDDVDEENTDSEDKKGQLAAAVVTHFDAEGDKREYIVEVTDPDAEVAMGPVRVTITVMNVNEAPTAPMEQRGGLSVRGRENVMFDEILADDTSPDLMVGTYRGIGVDAANAVWSLSGLDMGDFTIDASTGELTFDAAPNYEMPMDADTDNRYQITVEANDGTNTATLPVTVMVVNVDEMGRVTFLRDGADATDEAIMVGDMLTGLAEDPDGNAGDEPPITDMYPDISGATWQWEKSMTPAVMNSWMDIQGAMAAAYTVMAGDAGYYLRATATYEDGEGMGKTAYEMTEAAVGDTTTMPPMDIVSQYAGDDGVVNRSEAVQAVLDYLIRGMITRDEAIKVVIAYILAP